MFAKQDYQLFNSLQFPALECLCNNSLPQVAETAMNRASFAQQKICMSHSTRTAPICVNSAGILRFTQHPLRPWNVEAMGVTKTLAGEFLGMRILLGLLEFPRNYLYFYTVNTYVQYIYMSPRMGVPFSTVALVKRYQAASLPLQCLLSTQWTLWPHSIGGAPPLFPRWDHF